MSKMEVYYKLYYLLNFFVIVFFQNSLADVQQTCLCTTKADTTVSINCHKIVLFDLNILYMCPQSVKYSGTISSIDLSESNVTSLPSDMFEYAKNVQVINLSRNLLQEINESIFENLKDLKVLNLSHNRISVFHSTILPSLQVLDLSNNHIKDLDLEFDKAYPNLNYLSLSHNNLDDSMNGTLTLLRNLQYLDLSYNNYCLLDNEDFNFLSQLTHLNLSHNAIKSLSKQQFSANLLELNIGFNFLIEFPRNLSNIQTLNIENNQIKSMDGFSNELNNLLYINVKANFIDDLPNLKLEHLKVLDLSNNKISFIPETLNINNYPALQTLILNENPLINIEFPSNLNLRSLVMSNLSKLTEIKENSFIMLNNTDYCLNLTLTDNKNLQLIDEKAFKRLNLCFLNLKNNNISYLPADIFNYGLKTKFGVDLQKNPFHCNCSLQWMISDFVPWLYTTNPNLLDNLRCSSPEILKGKRMVHWYKWKKQVFCNDLSSITESGKLQQLLGLPSSETITLKMSKGSLLILVMVTTFLFVLVMIGIIIKRRSARRRSRINRRF